MNYILRIVMLYLSSLTLSEMVITLWIWARISVSLLLLLRVEPLTNLNFEEIFRHYIKNSFYAGGFRKALKLCESL